MKSLPLPFYASPHSSPIPFVWCTLMGESKISQRPGSDTDRNACLSLQVSFGSQTVPWRTGPSSTTQGSCPSQTLPLAWTGLTWLMQHGPLKVTSLAKAAGTFSNCPQSLPPGCLMYTVICKRQHILFPILKFDTSGHKKRNLILILTWC